MEQRYRIVVGVDGSEAGERALRWAMRAAAKRAGSVRAVIVWTPDGDSERESQRSEDRNERGAGPHTTDAAEPDPAPRQEERRALARQTLGASVAAALNDNPRVRVSTQISTGCPGDVLVDTATKADLLVLGSHGHVGLDQAALGPVAEHCVRHATCPVVVVPVPQEAEERAP